uniref:Uncharacterized protein n=1 Tax=Octopus bimaculoides TaxID=37653 RepID=A0A0L8HMD4_OCTBM
MLYPVSLKIDLSCFSVWLWQTKIAEISESSSSLCLQFYREPNLQSEDSIPILDEQVSFDEEYPIESLLIFFPKSNWVG